MNKFLKLLPILIGITALADTKFELLLQVGLTETAIAWIKLLGLILALFLPSVNSLFAKDGLDNTDPFNTNIPKGTKV